MNFQDFFFAVNFIGLKILNVMPRFHRVPKSSALQKVIEGVGDRFILTDLVIIYTGFGSSYPPVSLEITTIASLTRETSAIIRKKLPKDELAYSSNTI